MKNISILLAFILLCQCKSKETMNVEPVNPFSDLIQMKSVSIMQADGQYFRDLNHNGRMDIYEDPSQPIEVRVNDLLSQMTLEEKAGMMFINGVPISRDGLPDGKDVKPGMTMMLPSVVTLMDEKKMLNFNIWDIPDDPSAFAKWYNNTQQMAEKARLGIPITIASDPRHHLGKNVIAMEASGFTQFCEMPGFAAVGDEDLVRQFAEVVREEYLAIGIRESLHPQIDLATEPRWPRISGNFSEDAELTARLVKPYIEGMQTDNLANGVACMTKHFPGGGPQNEGLDPHFSFQKGQIYPGDNFDYHLIPFEAAFEANTSAIMPYYGIPVGQTDEDVAMAYNKAIITTLLREKYNYDGVVCTDWGLITDLPMGPAVWKARAWGVEHLEAADRALKIIEAGCDQFGGESRPELVVQLVNEGKLSEERIDMSVKRILRQKFELGLFDNPYIDESKVSTTLRTPEALALAKRAQTESLTLLKDDDRIIPLDRNQLNIYIENMDSSTVAKYGTVVSTPEEANVAIIRANTPWVPVDTKNFFAKSFHHGDLDFKGEEKERILKICNAVPTIFNIYLDRPAVFPEINDAAEVVIADYGTSDENLCQVLFGFAEYKGRLPFELPSSMKAVREQKADLPYDSKDPLYPFGYGLEYMMRR